ncbi:hypothetical protein HHI36_018751 [Cryptolaemus montrouzieri]|uniref:Uncharacterized protein n=1 Tax=Cryptolaemus montrouzieri TaxID=559131 RepID=A0ABD2P120_9CUCU
MFIYKKYYDYVVLVIKFCRSSYVYFSELWVTIVVQFWYSQYFVLNYACLFFSGFDLSKSQDANGLLNLLENGTISDLDEEIDNGIIQEMPQKNVHIGSNIIPATKRMRADHFEGEIY